MLAAFARHQDTAIAPTRNDLLATIKLAVKAGTISPAQTAWLADNKEQPAHAYRAVQRLLGDAFTTQHGLFMERCSSLLRQWPIPQITAFVTAWMRQDNNLVDANLLDLLKQASTHHDRHRESLPVDPDTLSSALSNFIERIASTLNQFHSYTDEQGLTPLCPMIFSEHLSCSGALALETADVIGVELSDAASNQRPDYWSLLKLSIYLISIYLQPMALPQDIDDTMMMRFEDEENDIAIVDEYLKNNELPDTPDNVNRALADCERSLCAAEDYEDITMFRTRNADALRVLNEWKMEYTRADDLPERIQALPTPETDTERAILAIASDLQAILSRDISPMTWSDISEGIPYPFLNTIVFRASDHAVQEQAQLFYEDVMNMGFDESDMDTHFKWTSSPETLLEISRRLGFSAQLLSQIISL